MSSCIVPPAGWTCSREFGHAGPCAASPTKPYDEHINKTMSEIERLEEHGSMSRSELREYLTETWMEGLKYSLVMLESEKRRRDDQQD